MSPEAIEGLFADLAHTARENQNALSLDQMGEMIGARAISPAQIEELIDRLEREGFRVGGDDRVDLAAALRTVIQTALQLKQRGVTPQAHNIAEVSGLSEQTVRVALLYSEVIRRPH